MNNDDIMEMLTLIENGDVDELTEKSKDSWLDSSINDMYAKAAEIAEIVDEHENAD